jgi:6-phosphofructokinase 1
MYTPTHFEQPVDQLIEIKRIAILTSGGETPGMNSAIRAVVRTADKQGIEVLGIHRGFCGLIQQDFVPLSSQSVSQISQGGGSILHCGSCTEFYQPEIRTLAAKVLQDHKVQALIVMGGKGSISGAALLAQEAEIALLALPGTIENDIPGSDVAIGFDTAINTAVDAIDKLQDTAYSHQRLFLVEVAGKASGFIASQVALAIGAEMLIVPEYSVDLKSVAKGLSENQRCGVSTNSMVILAEGSAEPKLIRNLATELKTCGEDPRICVLGHIQRGGAPTAQDRALAATLGNNAVHALLAGVRSSVLAIQSSKVVTIPFDQVINKTKDLPESAMRLVAETGR